MKLPALRIAVKAVAFAALVASCGDNVVDPKLPQGAVQFTPPSYYANWWEMTKSCSGRSGSLADVKWYQVPADYFPLNGDAVSAYWSAGTNQIVLSSQVKDDGQVVRHEMLHALLGEKGHSRDQFLESCAGYVTCTTQCVSEAGSSPPVPATVPRVPPTALQVTMTIDPVPNQFVPPSNGGYFSVTVRARNPTDGPVFVELPFFGSSVTSFAYIVGGPATKSERVVVHDSRSALFAPGETKVHVFDLFADRQGSLPRHLYAGTYTVRGMFGNQSSPDQGIGVH